MIVDDGENLFGLCIKTKGTNGVDKLLGGNIAAVIIVKDIEAVFDSLDIIFFKVFVSILFGVKSLE